MGLTKKEFSLAQMSEGCKTTDYGSPGLVPMETSAQRDSNENAADCRSDAPSAIQSHVICLDLWVRG